MVESNRVKVLNRNVLIVCLSHLSEKTVQKVNLLMGWMGHIIILVEPKLNEFLDSLKIMLFGYKANGTLYDLIALGDSYK